MEAKPATSLYGGTDSERGAGGKLRKSSARKSHATPYDRPSSNQQGRRWWLSKLVDPAYRLVASGATKILPAFFSTTPSVTALPPPPENLDEQDVEVTPNAEGNERCTLNYGASGPSEVAAQSNCYSDKLEQDEPENTENDSQFSGIEQLIKGKTFSGDEINRLVEILSSRVSDASDAEGRKKNEILTTAGGNVEQLPASFFKASEEGNQEDLNKVAITSPVPVPQIVPDEITASPIEIARAYMGSRLSEYRPSPSAVSSKDETAQQLVGEFALKPFIPSSAPRLSPCWPGAMAQEQHGYTTPNQRGRHGLRDFPRTPYSRTIYSKSTAKMTQVQTDSKYLNNLSNPFKQSQVPIFEQVKYKSDDSYRSVGPIRRLRMKYASEVRPRQSVFSKYSKDAPSVTEQPIVPRDNQSDLQEYLHLGETSTSKQQPGHIARNRVSNKPFSNPSANEAVKKILDQLDRHKPTTQEKINELKLAGAWRKSPPDASGAIPPKANMGFSLSEELGSQKKTDVIDSKLISKENIFGDHSKVLGDFQERIIEAKETEDTSNKASSKANGDSLMKTDVNTRFLFSFKGTSSSPMKSFEENTSEHVLPKHQNYEQLVTTSQDDFNFETSKKPPLHSSGIRPNLAHISVGRRYSSQSVSSDNNGTGFSFPVSTSRSALSEPPTPSIMPFSSGGVVSQPKDVPTIPDYSFGTKSTPRLVFSFPSTSNAPTNVDAHDLKFDFGSDKKTRLSFSSVGKDAICY